MASVRVRLLLAATFSLFASSVAAQTVLTFEGLQNTETVLNFYSGGFGGSGSGPGPNFGVTFSPSALAARDATSGGSANTANDPSPPTTMVFLTTTAIMSVPAGFTTGFSFFYSSSRAASVIVYDGLNGTGNVLATIPLAANTPANNCQITTGVTYCNWTPVGATFSGVARSIDFGGTANQVGYDNITIGSGTPAGVPTTAREVPALGLAELLTLALFAAMIGALSLRRRSA